MGNMSKDIVENEEFSNSYIVLETYSKNLYKIKKKEIWLGYIQLLKILNQMCLLK